MALGNGESQLVQPWLQLVQPWRQLVYLLTLAGGPTVERRSFSLVCGPKEARVLAVCGGWPAEPLVAPAEAAEEVVLVPAEAELLAGYGGWPSWNSNGHPHAPLLG